MDVSPILKPLNPAQRQAVTAAAGPALVLAGAGSGKTRVLTHRIAWLTQTEGVSPLQILAVTFTNKAAQEMRRRIETLLEAPVGGMWMGTFHSLCHRLLRLHAEAAGLPSGFEIIDNDDQYRLIRRTLRAQSLDEAHWPPRLIQRQINSHKDAARRPEDLPTPTNPPANVVLAVYHAYEESCRRLALVDFAELLLRAWELLRNNQAIREHYQRRFLHVLVDEFQDTNGIQYQWLRLLSGRGNLFAVGDDDQSIYGWRGAQVENLLSFEKDFPGATIVRLEQNYRSSGNILKAANAVIARNSARLGKELWTQAAAGEPLRLYAASNEMDEARFVVSSIAQAVENGLRRSDIAVLYRSNAQSRALEEEFITAAMPYRVYGGLRFFERAEIKDALAYLRLLAHRDSDPAFMRIVNLPVRGIGAKTLEPIRARAQQKNISLWRASLDIVAAGALSARAASALQHFHALIDGLATHCADLELGESTDHVLTHSGLLEHFRSMRGELAQGRVENLEELVTAARNFTPSPTPPSDATAPSTAEAPPEALTQFLANTALDAGDGQAEAWQDSVQLMTLHAAKGLEFPLVFLCGMEEGLFPHQRSIEEPDRLQEERRLCYVGMTRAQQRLVICYAEARRMYGQTRYAAASRFLGEIPPDCVEELRSPRMTRPLLRPASPPYRPPHPPSSPSHRPVTSAQHAAHHAHQSAQHTAHGSTARQSARHAAHGNAVGDSITPGRRIRHPTFGEGTVTHIEGQGAQARIQINFARVGSKWLVSGYAPLELL